jgi:hypothetical protein
VVGTQAVLAMGATLLLVAPALVGTGNATLALAAATLVGSGAGLELASPTPELDDGLRGPCSPVTLTLEVEAALLVVSPTTPLTAGVSVTPPAGSELAAPASCMFSSVGCSKRNFVCEQANGASKISET